VAYEALYLKREKGEEIIGKCVSGREGNPPPVVMRAVFYVVSDNEDDKENEHDNTQNEKKQTLVRAIDGEVCEVWVIWWGENYPTRSRAILTRKIA
jgi:hypothetical protein